MTDNFDSNQEAPQQPQQQPDVPEKFRNADGSVNVAALSNSYRELERAFSQRQQSAPAPQPPQQPQQPQMTPEMIAALANEINARKDLARTTFGDEQNFAKAREWAKTNLSPEEIQAYEHMVRGNQFTAKQALSYIKEKYDAAMGTQGENFVNGNTGGSAAGPAFQSQAEMAAAMNDPRYRTDPAYRAQVEARVAGMPVSRIQ